MNRDHKNHKRLLIVSAIVFGLVFFGLLAFAIWDTIASKKSIIRLGDYSSLTYTSSSRDEARAEVTELVVSRSKFGGLVKEEAESLYRSTMDVYREEAEYLKTTLPEYIKAMFGTTEEQLRKDVRKSALEVAKEEAVLDAIADRENITLTEIRFDKILQKYMEEAGYTDRKKYLVDYNEKDLRVRMRRELTADWLLERATGPALDEGDTE